MSLFAASGPVPAPPASQRRSPSPIAAALPLQERAAAARRDSRTRVEHAQQQGKLGLDLGLMLGRSTRAGWGPGGLLASVGKLASMQLRSSKILDRSTAKCPHSVILAFISMTLCEAHNEDHSMQMPAALGLPGMSPCRVTWEAHAQTQSCCPRTC